MPRRKPKRRRRHNTLPSPCPAADFNGIAFAYPITVTAAGGCRITARRMVSTAADASPAHLASTYARDGYLLLRSFLPSADVRAARLVIVTDLRKTGHVDRVSRDDDDDDDANEEPICAIISKDGGGGCSGGEGPSLLKRQDLATSSAVSAVLEHPKLAALMRLLHPPPPSGPQTAAASPSPRARGLPRQTPSRDLSPAAAKPHPFKWLRAVGPSQHTGPHIDRVYFPSLHTAWIPLGNIPPRLGSLLVVPGSHTSPAFEHFRSTYGSSTVGRDGTTSGWCCDDAGRIGEMFGIDACDLQWVTEEMRMGDVVVVDQSCLHMSATNCSDPPEWRISCDTRWFC
ncbi:hypothetical protein HDU86_005463 [Geranomyces michiganensis]|nr:hypothetical protein HDU86_005463 [Geranomyces michiganensis]